VTDAGVFSNFGGTEVRMRDIVVADAKKGAGAMISTKNGDQPHFSMITDSIFFGKTINPDCPDEKK
jgi:hypothetical protein